MPNKKNACPAGIAILNASRMNRNMKAPPVVVIGAGIVGVSAAV